MIFFLLFIIAAALLEPVRIDIRERVHVKLLVGNPGRLLAFRLNFTLSEILLHGSPSAALGSSSTLELSPQQESELFYIGRYALRLPVRFAPDPTHPIAQLEFPTGFAGTLGLGVWSPLWKYWRSLTYSSTSLLLGDHDQFAKLDPYGPELQLQHGCTADQQICLDLSSLDTRLPELHALPSLPARIGELLPLGEQEVWLPLAAHSYSALACSPDDRIWLGERLIRDSVLFCDWDSGLALLSPSVFSFQETDFDAACALLQLFTVGLWFALALQRPSSSVWLVQLMLFIELYVYFASSVITVINIAGMRWERFLSSFLQQNAWPPLLFLLLAQLSTSVVGAMSVLLLRSAQPSAKALLRTEKLRAFCFLTTANYTLWQCLLQDHRTDTDLVYLLTVATFLTFVSGLLALQHLGERWVWFVAAVTLLNYWFLLWCNLVPAFYALEVQENLTLALLFYVCALVLFPTWFVFAHLSVLSSAT
jgi:hypothetical protein